LAIGASHQSLSSFKQFRARQFSSFQQFSAFSSFQQFSAFSSFQQFSAVVSKVRVTKELPGHSLRVEPWSDQLSASPVNFQHKRCNCGQSPA
jgi:hypothetical protein